MKNQTQKSENTIVLASKSPRRKEILTRLGIPFISRPADINETITLKDPAEAVTKLAEDKVISISGVCSCGKSSCENNSFARYRWYLGADTVVVKGDKILGQPADEAEAERYLNSLSGNVHQVFTGIAFFDADNEKMYKGFSAANVYFATLSPAVIKWYISSGEWKGAAGGYRIQEKGECLTEKIEGSHSNVMGLPIRLLFCILSDAGYPVLNNFPPGR